MHLYLVLCTLLLVGYAVADVDVSSCQMVSATGDTINVHQLSFSTGNPCVVISGNGNTVNFLDRITYNGATNAPAPVGLLVSGSNNDFVGLTPLTAATVVVTGDWNTFDAFDVQGAGSSNTWITSPTAPIAAVTLSGSSNTITSGTIGNWNYANSIGVLVQGDNNTVAVGQSSKASGATTTLVGVQVQNCASAHVQATVGGPAAPGGYLVGVLVVNSSAVNAQCRVSSTAVAGNVSLVEVRSSTNVKASYNGANGVTATIGDASGVLVVGSDTVVVQASTLGLMTGSGSASSAYAVNIRTSANVQVTGFNMLAKFAASMGNAFVRSTDSTNVMINYNTFTSNSTKMYGVLSTGAGSVYVENNTIRLGDSTAIGVEADNPMTGVAWNTFSVSSNKNIQSTSSVSTVCANSAALPSQFCWPPASASSPYLCCSDTCTMQASSTTCRPAVSTISGTCDTPEYCLGGTPYCPSDSFLAPGTTCNGTKCGGPFKCTGTAVCDVPPLCNVPEGICKPDSGCGCKRQGYPYPRCLPICGDGICDPDENVTNTGYTCFKDCGFPACTDHNDCPPYASNDCCAPDCSFQPSSFTCRPVSGPCDAAERCTSTGPICPMDLVKPNKTICNHSNNSCTPTVVCDGFTKSCPPLIERVCGEYCGDGVCNLDESCQSCPLDCPCVTPCPDPTCSRHGTCDDGVCNCDQGYSGATCAVSSVPIIVVHNDTDSEIKVPGGNSTGGQVSFKISISRVFEIDPQDNVLPDNDFPLAGRDFNGTHENLTTSERWNTTTVLPNSASLQITSWYFYQSEEIDFANITIPIANYTLKNLIEVQDWPFKSYQNRLVFEFDFSNPKYGSCVSTSLQQDASGNVMYFSLHSGGVSLYCQLVRVIVLDDRYKFANFKVVNGTKLQVIAPHFWNSLIVDPNFSVLLDDNTAGYNNVNDTCSSKETRRKSSVNKLLVVKIVVPLAVLCILSAIAFAVIYPRYQDWRNLKKGKVQLESNTASVPTYEQQTDE